MVARDRVRRGERRRVEVGRRERRLARRHHVLVAAERVDLAVVAERAEGLRARPAGEGVRAEARVDEREVRGVVGLLEVLEVPPHLLGRQLPLVHERRVGERAHVKVVKRRLGVHRLLGGDPQPPELAVELRAAEAALCGDEQLLRHRLRLERRRPERRVVDGDGPPADELEARVRGDDALDEALALGDGGLVAREEDVARAEGARRRQVDAEVLAHRAPQEAVGHAREDAGAVARVGLAPAAAAVRHPHEHRVGVAHDLVRRLPLEVRHHADAAAVLLLRRVVEALLSRIPRQRLRGRARNSRARRRRGAACNLPRCSIAALPQCGKRGRRRSPHPHQATGLRGRLPSSRDLGKSEFFIFSWRLPALHLLSRRRRARAIS